MLARRLDHIGTRKTRRTIRVGIASLSTPRSVTERKTSVVAKTIGVVRARLTKRCPRVNALDIVDLFEARQAIHDATLRYATDDDALRCGSVGKAHGATKPTFSAMLEVNIEPVGGREFLIHVPVAVVVFIVADLILWRWRIANPSLRAQTDLRPLTAANSGSLVGTCAAVDQAVVP